MDGRVQQPTRALCGDGLGAEVEMGQPPLVRHAEGSGKPGNGGSLRCRMNWELLPLVARHAAAKLLQPLTHKDPSDELSLVQA